MSRDALRRRDKAPAPPGPPMRLGHMRQLGVRSLSVHCAGCGHRAVLDVGRHADDVEVQAFRSRLVCSGCGGRRVDVRPNWLEHRSTPAASPAPWGSGSASYRKP
jgi:hypothetical protein